jgi:hypothetical protein
MESARSRDTLLVHDIELFSLLAPEARDVHRPLECEDCGGDATYVSESTDGRGAHFRAKHTPSCDTASRRGPSDTVGRVSWREGGKPAVLDLEAPAVLLEGGEESAVASPDTRSRDFEGEARRASGIRAGNPPIRPTLATLLKFAERGAIRQYPSFNVQLAEGEVLDVARALCSLDELAERPIGARVVAFGRISAANVDEGKNLWLTWRSGQPVKIMIPAELVPSPIATGWELIRVAQYRPKLILVTTLNQSRAGRGYIRAERGLFLIDMRPCAAMRRATPRGAARVRP